jgi:23S rRNA pseudouridine2605 synthase
MRINAFLARAGVGARRKADEYIKGGRVGINGRTAQLNDQVSASDTVTLDGKPLSSPEKSTYIILNKPAGVITSLKDPEGRSTVNDIVTVPERIVPVGRLDYNTQGLLLLTNDGDLAARLMHPKYKVEKVYKVRLKQKISDTALERLQTGVQLEDGPAKALNTQKIDEHSFLITIAEGRNRQIRRMVAALNLRLAELTRVAYGPLSIDGLAAGQWRHLSQTELEALRKSPSGMVQ